RGHAGPARPGRLADDRGARDRLPGAGGAGDRSNHCGADHHPGPSAEHRPGAAPRRHGPPAADRLDYRGCLADAPPDRLATVARRARHGIVRVVTGRRPALARMADAEIAETGVKAVVCCQLVRTAGKGRLTTDNGPNAMA